MRIWLACVKWPEFFFDWKTELLVDLENGEIGRTTRGRTMEPPGPNIKLTVTVNGVVHDMINKSITH